MDRSPFFSSRHLRHAFDLRGVAYVASAVYILGDSPSVLTGVDGVGELCLTGADLLVLVGDAVAMANALICIAETRKYAPAFRSELPPVQQFMLERMAAGDV